LTVARGEYDRLIADPASIETVLQSGAKRAREHSAALMSQVRQAVGIVPLG
jgi:tryptophanyl-tRNA synthetase